MHWKYSFSGFISHEVISLQCHFKNIAKLIQKSLPPVAVYSAMAWSIQSRRGFPNPSARLGFRDKSLTFTVTSPSDSHGRVLNHADLHYSFRSDSSAIVFIGLFFFFQCFSVQYWRVIYWVSIQSMQGEHFAPGWISNGY
jgi:hypothetical protein